MDKKTLKDLKNIGLTKVVTDGKYHQDEITKEFVKGLRAGEFTGSTVSTSCKNRNQEVKTYIIEGMTRNKYNVLNSGNLFIKFIKGTETVTFHVVLFTKKDNSRVCWWCLSV